MRTLISDNYQDEIKNIVNEFDDGEYGMQPRMNNQRPLSQSSKCKQKKKKTPNKFKTKNNFLI